MPGGATSGTATVISSLPYTDSDTVTEGSPLWYVFTTPTPVDPVELGFYSFTPDVSHGQPQVSVRVFSPDDATSPTFYNAERVKPSQLALTAGTPYYFRISGTGAGVPHAYTLAVYAGPSDPAPAGSLVVPDDVIGFPLALLSSTDGTVLRFISPFPAGESGDSIATGAHTGRTLVYDASTGDLVLYDTDWTVLVDLPYGTAAELLNATFSIRTNSALSTFYVSNPKDPGHSNKQTVTTVSSAGVFGPTTWVLPNQGVLLDGGLAPSLDETILYVVNSANPFQAPVNRWDLVNNVALSDLVAGVTNYATHEVLVLADSSIVVMYQHNTLSNPPIVKRYDASGTTLNTYTFTGTVSNDSRLASALDDPVSFWAWTKLRISGVLSKSRFTNVKVSDGSTLTTFDVTHFEHGLYQAAITQPNANPQPRFGPSESCPFLITRQPPITGTIAATTVPTAADLTGYVLPPRHPPCPTV